MLDSPSDEGWRPIEGWPYEVSDKGQVRRSEGGKGCQPGYILKTYPVETKSPTNGGSYQKVALWRNGSRTQFFVHHLVAEAFIGSRPEGYETNHKNGIKDDNRPENLEWVTSKENTEHARSLGRQVVGEKVCTSKLTRPDVREIRRRYRGDERVQAGGVTQRELAEEFGVGRRTISDIVNHKSWRHVE